MKMLEDLEEVVRACDDANGHAPLSDTELYLRAFIKRHHATIRDMAVRLEAAERDAAIIRELVGSWRALERISGNQAERGVFKLCADQIDQAMQETGR